MQCRSCLQNKKISSFQKNKKICKKCFAKYVRTLKSNRRQSGKCIRCGIYPPRENMVHCDLCINKRRAYEKGFLEQGLCGRCKARPVAQNLTTCEECNLERKQADKNQKEETIQHYGGSCANCGISNTELLCIDHINNDGNKHRKTFKSEKLGVHMYRWLKKNNYPKGFQVLCLNCNQKKELQQRTLLKVKHPDARARRQLIKYEVMRAYGGECSMCGELDVDKLTIDHVNRIKNEMYQGIPNYGDKLYAWLKKNNMADGFRVLCMNCNFKAAQEES